MRVRIPPGPQYNRRVTLTDEELEAEAAAIPEDDPLAAEVAKLELEVLGRAAVETNREALDRLFAGMDEPDPHTQQIVREIARRKVERERKVPS